MLRCAESSAAAHLPRHASEHTTSFHATSMPSTCRARPQVIQQHPNCSCRDTCRPKALVSETPARGSCAAAALHDCCSHLIKGLVDHLARASAYAFRLQSIRHVVSCCTLMQGTPGERVLHKGTAMQLHCLQRATSSPMAAVSSWLWALQPHIHINVEPTGVC
jgi:hypothetical protein